MATLPVPQASPSVIVVCVVVPPASEPGSGAAAGGNLPGGGEPAAAPAPSRGAEPALRRLVARDLLDVMREMAPAVEAFPAGAFLAVAGTTSSPGLMRYAAEHARDLVGRRLGLRCTAGAGPNRTLARAAATLAGSGAALALLRADVPTRLWPLPVGDLPGVGARAAGRLARLGVQTIGDVAALGPNRCERWLGPAGRRLWMASYGRDDRPPPAAPRTPQGQTLFAGAPFDLALTQVGGAGGRPAARPAGRHPTWPPAPGRLHAG